MKSAITSTSPPWPKPTSNDSVEDDGQPQIQLEQERKDFELGMNSSQQQQQQEQMGPSSNNASKEEYQQWLSKVKKNGRELRKAPDHIRNDKKIVIAAVQQWGLALEYASPELKNDKKIVIAAVQQWGLAFEYASLELRNDKEVVMAAIQQSKGFALKYASPDIRKDRDFMLEVVRRRGYALRYASPELKNDKEVVMASVKEHGYALQFATPELQNDKEVVMAAVQRKGYALKHASPEIQSDREFVLAAVQQHGYALKYALPEYRNDKVVVLAAIKQKLDVIKFAGEELKRDPEVLIAAGMFDEAHHDRNTTSLTDYKKIALSTRFSLDPKSKSQATKFTKLLKDNEYIRKGNFIVFAPNAFDKETCDPNWTDFDWPCRGTKETCRFPSRLKTGHPTDNCCWRYSYRYHLKEAKNTKGFMLQLVETGKLGGKVDNATLGKGQKIERDMAQSMEMKVFRVYRPVDKKNGYEKWFYKGQIDEVVTAIKKWYDEGRKDMSECVVRPTA